MAVSQSLTVTQESQSITNNTSVIRIKWTSTQSGESRNLNSRTASYTIAVTKNGETTKKEYAVSYTLPQNQTKTILNKTFTISHGSNGACSVKVSTEMDTRISAGVVKKTKTLTLDTIPRKSTLTVADGTLGTAQTLKITEKASAFYHKLTYSCGSASDYILGSKDTRSKLLESKWEPPLVLAKQNTAGKTVDITFELHTYASSTGAYIGTNSYTKTFKIPSSLGPGTPEITLTDTTKLGTKSLFAEFGKYVQNKSKIKVSATASTTGSQGASISSYTIYLDGTKCSSSTITPTSSGDKAHTIKVVATDSRGYTSSRSTTINVYSYSKPTITLSSPIKSGDTLKLPYTVTYSSLGSKNKFNIDLYSTPKLIDSARIVSNSTTKSGTYSISQYDSDTTYNNVYLKVTDILSETDISLRTTIWGAERVFSVTPDGTGVSFGKKATESKCLESKYKVVVKSNQSGLYLTNHKNTTEPGIFRNESDSDKSNLWIGATATNGTHITNGGTFISAGDNDRLYVNKKSGDTRVNYSILDSGNYGKSLYSSSGNSGTVTLSQSAADFSYLEIFYCDNRSKYDSTKISSPNGKTFPATIIYTSDTASVLWIKNATYLISGTTITKNDYSLTRLSDGKTDVGKDDEDVNGTKYTPSAMIRIYKVLGYK